MNVRDDFYLVDNEQINSNVILTAKSKLRMQKSKADNTIKSYSADWNDFADWCELKGVTAMPCLPETIVNYINDLADDAKANTVSRRITAISENHIAAGYSQTNPAKDGLVRNAMRAIRREKGTFQKGKSPILMETIELLAECFEDDSLTTLRDKAVILLGFAGAFRRSELVAVRVEDITFMPQGMVIFIPQSKGDQLGHGSQIAIPYSPNPKCCAVVAVKQWLQASEIHSGPIFHPIDRWGKIREIQLSDKSVALIVKKYVSKLGLDESEFAGHSLRRGFATSAAQHDLDTLSIMRQTRHKSEKMVHRYIEQGNLFKRNPLNKMFDDNDMSRRGRY